MKIFTLHSYKHARNMYEHKERKGCVYFIIVLVNNIFLAMQKYKEILKLPPPKSSRLLTVLIMPDD